MNQRSTYLDPETLLRRDVARIDVHMSYRHTYGVGGCELRRQRNATENDAEKSDGDGAFDTHSHTLYQALGLNALDIPAG